MFKLDLMALDGAACGDRNTVSDGCWRGRAVREELTRQLVAAGAPEGDLDTQFSALLASHKAMAEAGEEMPSIDDVLDAGELDDSESGIRRALYMCRSIVARLRRERDEALALLAKACDYEATAADVRASCSSPANIGIGDPPPKPPPSPPSVVHEWKCGSCGRVLNFSTGHAPGCPYKVYE